MHGSVTDSINENHVQPSEPDYEVIDPKGKIKVDSDVKMATNPAYHYNVIGGSRISKREVPTDTCQALPDSCPAFFCNTRYN